MLRTTGSLHQHLPASEPLAGLGFLAALVATVGAYALGLPGQFMFDDFPNLQTVADYGGVRDLTTLRLYLSDQFAGPTGRPISMLSFLLDVRQWPADPGPVKLHNVLLHGANGALLFLLLVAALRHSRVPSTGGAYVWIAALAAAWWLLHPLHVSTVLYAVQRMAQLSTFFVLAGLLGYVLGRGMLASRPKLAYSIMAVSIGLGTILATFSKENGALLPVFALVLEATILDGGRRARPDRTFLTVFLWLPTAMICAYLLYKGISSPQAGADTRGFDRIERLMTQARIIFDYLGHLLIPRWQTEGVFRDTVTVSRSLLSPPVTALAVTGVSGMFVAAVWARRRLPLLSAAILFFLAGHLLESTIITLELYFEHRNYLPAALLFLPIARGVVWLFQRSPLSAITAALGITLLLGGFLASRASLWGDRDTLYLVWAQELPTSPRAQLSAANVLQNAGAYDAAMAHIDSALRAHPSDTALLSQKLRMQLAVGDVDRDLVDRFLSAVETARFSGEVITNLTQLSAEVRAASSSNLTRGDMLETWRKLGRNRAYGASQTMRSRIEHEQGILQLDRGNVDAAVRHFRTAATSSGRAQTAIKQAAILATHDHHCPALEQLDLANALLAGDDTPRAKVGYYAREITRLRDLIADKLPRGRVSCDLSGSG